MGEAKRGMREIKRKGETRKEKEKEDKERRDMESGCREYLWGKRPPW